MCEPGGREEAPEREHILPPARVGRHSLFYAAREFTRQMIRNRSKIRAKIGELLFFRCVSPNFPTKRHGI